MTKECVIMNKTEIKNATTQTLIEQLMSLEGIMSYKQGERCKGEIKESVAIATELSKRNLIDLDSFIKHKELEL